MKLTGDEYWMHQAILEARKAYRINETPIGCVIVRTHDYEGRPLGEPAIIARGHNRRNTDKKVTSHAEITAIDRASRVLGDWRLEGCTMYVTLEPCPMCAGALVQARIDRVVIGAMNPKAGSAGSVLNLLEEPGFNHQAEVTRGVLKAECTELLVSFFEAIREEKKKEKKGDA
ncbi:MAG: tRNA adenosine(34) deaminase TadA [Lachnospiraceae bacterium]|nr:tRNA adenosine(34) deaminase TadA [Lachnospiraceae bacterium]